MSPLAGFDPTGTCERSGSGILGRMLDAFAPRRLMLQQHELALFAVTTVVAIEGTTARAEALELVNVGPDDAVLTGISVRWSRQDGAERSADYWRRHRLTSVSKCVLLDESDLARLVETGGDASLHTEDGLRHVTLSVLIGGETRHLTFTYENWGNARPHLSVEIQD